MTDRSTPIIIVTPKDKTQATALIKQFSKAKLFAQIVEVPLFDAPAADKPAKPGKLPTVDLPALKVILTRVKEELGSDVLKNLFVTHDCKKLGDLPKKEWATMHAEAEALLSPGDEVEDEEMDPFDLLDDDEEEEVDELGLDDDDDDLGLDDDDELDLEDTDGDEMDAPALEDVKKLASKFSDRHGLEKQREVLSKYGIATTRSLGKATPEQLTKISNAFLRGLK